MLNLNIRICKVLKPILTSSLLSLVITSPITSTVIGSSKAKYVKNNEIVINSDNLTYDKNKNIAYFTNHVVLWFNDMIMSTSNIIIYYKQIDGKNKIDKIIIPNKLHALKNISSDVLIANSGTYCFETGKLQLEGDVILKHEENILRTKELTITSKLRKIADHQEQKN